MKTNIAFYLMTGGDGMGGAWALFMEYLDWLDRDVYNPVVFYYCRNAKTDVIRRNDFAKRQMRVIDVNEYGVPLECLSRFNQPLKFKLILETVKTALFFRKQKLDVLHFVLGWYPSHQLPIIAGGLANIKVRLSDILLTPQKSHQGRKLQTMINYWADKSPTHVRSMSQRDIKNIETNAFVDRDKISWILPSVDVESYDGLKPRREEFRGALPVDPGDRVFLSLGRLSKIKAPLQYIESIQQVADLARERKAKFLIAGDGSLYEDMDQKIKALGLSDIVFLLGYVANNAEIMIACDVFVNHSLLEGGPMTFMEALAAGKPAISTDVGFTTEIIKQIGCGATVPVGDTAAMAECLREYILKTDSEIIELGQKSYLFAKNNLIPEKVKASFDGIYMSGTR